MTPIFGYNNYRDFLNDVLLEKKKQRQSQSLRSFAANLGISPSYFSRVLSGERHLSLEAAHNIARALRLAHEETLHFTDLVQIESTDDPRQKNRILEQIAKNRSMPTHFISMEEFKAVAEWYHFAIISLSQTKGFKEDPRWIAQRLGISRVEAGLALERLLSLGFLKKNGRHFEVIDRVSHQTPHDLASAAVRENHRQHLELASKALDELAIELREFANRTLNMNMNDIPEAKRKIRNFLDRFNREMDRPQGQEVFQLNLQFYRLSKTEKGLA